MSNNLKESISILYDMELNNYLMTRAIGDLDKEIDGLCAKKEIKKPKQKFNNVSIVEGFMGAFFGGVLGLIIGAVLGFIRGAGFFGKIWEVITNGIGFCFIFAVAGTVVGLVVKIVQYFLEKKDLENDYVKQLSAYENEKRNDKIRLELEEKQRAVLSNQKESLIDRKRDAIKKLNNFYDMVGIDETFRNLMSMGYMNEYLRLEIATQLTGFNGLYHLTKKDLKMDEINVSLEMIAERMDELVDVHKDLYRELRAINEKCSLILKSTLEQIKSNKQILENMQVIAASTSIAAYNSQRIKKELSYQNYFLSLS